jgi:nucleotide-binding universal stress UspA family protein
MCVEMGANYALAGNKAVYELKGHRAELYEYAGEKVRVRGERIERNTIIVESVTPVVMETDRARKWVRFHLYALVCPRVESARQEIQIGKSGQNQICGLHSQPKVLYEPFLAGESSAVPARNVGPRHSWLSQEKLMRILLAIDDSKFSEAATRALIEQIKPSGNEVRVLHVMEPMTLGSEIYIRDWEEVSTQLQVRAQALLKRTAEALQAKGFRAETVLEEGDLKSIIMDVGEKWPADLIVMGSHGRKGLSRFLLGSTSESVVRHAHCSVQVVRLAQSKKSAWSQIGKQP